MRYKHLVLSLIGVAVLGFGSGCAFETDVDTEESAPLIDDQRIDGAGDYELDAAGGDEIAVQDHQLPGEPLMMSSDDRGGPDPTPWKLAGGDDGDDAGPDPTPWHERDEDDDDDFPDAPKVNGPDPTPWSPDGAHDDDGDDDDPRVRGLHGDGGEPDPQPWRTSQLHRTRF